MTMRPVRATRRAVLAGAGAAGLAVAVAGCAANGAGDPTSGGAATTTLPTSEVPVGGGTVVADAQVVVTQPAHGVFKAFSAVCTHQGCLVAGVVNGQIVCPCHNSVFSATDGSVMSGPARQPLAARTLHISGTVVTLG